MEAIIEWYRRDFRAVLRDKFASRLEPRLAESMRELDVFETLTTAQITRIHCWERDRIKFLLIDRHGAAREQFPKNSLDKKGEHS
jgi:hypothetical protein